MYNIKGIQNDQWFVSMNINKLKVVLMNTNILFLNLLIKVSFLSFSKLDKQSLCVTQVHVDIECHVTYFESHLWSVDEEERGHYLSTWQRNKLISIKVRPYHVQTTIYVLGLYIHPRIL